MSVSKTLLASLTLLFACRSFGSATKMSGELLAFDFEVFGKVQQVFFRKFTQETAEKLGVRGWCKNTPEGTVVGQAEGPKEQMGQMKQWLQVTGSPMSSITKAVFKNERTIEKYSYEDFSIVRKKKNV